MWFFNTHTNTTYLLGRRKGLHILKVSSRKFPLNTSRLREEPVSSVVLWLNTCHDDQKPLNYTFIHSSFLFFPFPYRLQQWPDVALIKLISDRQRSEVTAKYPCCHPLLLSFLSQFLTLFLSSHLFSPLSSSLPLHSHLHSHPFSFSCSSFGIPLYFPFDPLCPSFLVSPSSVFPSFLTPLLPRYHLFSTEFFRDGIKKAERS